MKSLICVLVFISGVLSACQHNCYYRGKCNNSKCQCNNGFKGVFCETDCGCNGYGTCMTGSNTCKCDDGWKYYNRECVWDCRCSDGAPCIGPGECGCKQTCKMGNCRNGQCQCWQGYKGADCSQYDPSIMMNHGVKMGINLAGITYFSSELKFVDIAKQSQEWITQRDGISTWDTKEQNKIHWLSDGYPAALSHGLRVAKLIYRNFGSHEETGQYTILWDGEGEVTLGLSRYKILYSGKGRMVVQFDQLGPGGILIKIGMINPKLPIRNLRFIAPGYEHINGRFPFHPVFLENLKRYSEIRFMDFYHTNAHGPEPTTWYSRHNDKYHTQEGVQGGAIEHMVDLSNRLGANPWFCVPHAADDHFVEEFAKLVKSKLRPDLKIYVEYSNEVWNGIFRQAKYNKEQGLSLRLSSEGFKAGYMYYNKRSSEVMAIWNRIFGGEASKRVSGVWAWQTGYQDYYRQALDNLGQKINNFKNIAVTGYFDCQQVADKHAKELPGMSMTQIQHYCKQELPDLEKVYRHYMDLAKSHGVQLVMYEGGPSVMESSAIAHFGQNNKATTDKAIAFNRDDHMEQSVMDVLNVWHRVVTKDPATKDGGFFNYFSYTQTPSKYGSWGMLEYTGQNPNNVSKSRGVQAFITSMYANVPRGPRCTFIKNGGIAYGCFNTGSRFECGITDNNGRTWSKYNLPGSDGSNGDTLVLDGYDQKNFKVYIRVTDRLGSNSYHVYNIKSQQWTTPTNFFYYSGVASQYTLPPMPAGVFAGLNGHAKC